MSRQRLIELRDECAKMLVEARSRLDQIKDDTPAEQAASLNAEYDRIMADHDKRSEQADRLEKQMDSEARSAEAAARAREERRPPTDDTRAARAAGAAPDAAAVFKRALQWGPGALSSEERAVFEAHCVARNVPAELRAQGTTSGAVGAYTIPQLFLPEITKSMALWGPMMDGGIVREIVTDGGNPLPWPTVDDTANASAQVAENAASATTGSDVAFGQKQLDAYVHRSGVVLVPTELLQDSAFDVQSLLNDLLGERIGRGGNTALTTGTGSSQPNGVATAAANGKTAAATNAITFDEVLDLTHSVDPAYRGAPSCRYMLHDTTLLALRKLKDGQNNYLWQMGDVRAGQPATLNGYPYSINQAMAHVGSGVSSRVLLFGDFKKYILRRVRDFNLIVMRERYAEALQVGFLAWARFDGELSDTAAIKRLTLAAA